LALVATAFFVQEKLSLTGYAAINTISFVKAGGNLAFEVKVDGVKEMEATFTQDIKDAVVVTEEVKDVGWDFKGTVYSKFKVSSSDADKFGAVVFTLKIKERDLTLAGLFPEEVKLYANGKEAETILTKTEEGYYYYTAKSTGLGEYVIGKAEKPTAKAAVPATVPAEMPKEIAPVVEESPAAAPAPSPETTKTTESLPLTGKAGEQSSSSDGFFQKVSDLFKGWFS
jgi:hypothetical protein